MATLQQRLDEFKRTFESGVPPYNATRETIETMHRAAAELKASGAEDVALTVGDRAPAFTLMNQDVVHVALGDLLRAGPLVVYESFGNASHRFHNEPSFRVPIPARYAIDTSGIIRTADVNPSSVCGPPKGAGVYYGATPMVRSSVSTTKSLWSAAAMLRDGRPSSWHRVRGVYTCWSAAMDSRKQCPGTPFRRIEDNPNIVVRTRTQLTTLEGNGRHNESDGVTNEPVTPTHDIGHAFIMIGAVPNTKWLAGCVVLDENGFVKTGPDLSREELDPAGRSLARSPFLLETSRPGVFAVGDARSSRRSLNSTVEWRPRGTGIQVKKSSMFSKGRRWSTRSKESRR